MPLSALKSLICCLVYLTCFSMTAEKLLNPVFQNLETCSEIMRSCIKPLQHHENTFMEELKRGEKNMQIHFGVFFS